MISVNHVINAHMTMFFRLFIMQLTLTYVVLTVQCIYSGSMAGYSYSIVYKLLNSRGGKVVDRTIYSYLSKVILKLGSLFI